MTTPPAVCPDCGVDHAPVPFLQITCAIDRTHPDVDSDCAIVLAIGVGAAPPEVTDPGFLGELELALVALAGHLPARLSAAWAQRN